MTRDERSIFAKEDVMTMISVYGKGLQRWSALSDHVGYLCKYMRYACSSRVRPNRKSTFVLSDLPPWPTSAESTSSIRTLFTITSRRFHSNIPSHGCFDIDAGLLQ